MYQCSDSPTYPKLLHELWILLWWREAELFTFFIPQLECSMISILWRRKGSHSFTFSKGGVVLKDPNFSLHPVTHQCLTENSVIKPIPLLSMLSRVLKAKYIFLTHVLDIYVFILILLYYMILNFYSYLDYFVFYFKHLTCILRVCRILMFSLYMCMHMYMCAHK